MLSLLLSPLSWRSILLKTQAVLYVQQEPYKANQFISKSANTSIATSIYRSIKNLDPFLYYKFLQCIFLCWIFCALHLSLLHLRLYKSSLQRIFWQPYHTAVRLHVYLDFVKSIEQELKIQWEYRSHRNFDFKRPYLGNGTKFWKIEENKVQFFFDFESR